MDRREFLGLAASAVFLPLWRPPPDEVRVVYPTLPTSISGAYVIGDTDEAVQGRVIKRLGKPWGLWYDDTVPSLDKWVALGLAKCQPLGQAVMVCVPPGRPNHHYPEPIISVYERYVYGMASPPEAWGPCPKFNAYICQWSFPGTVSRRPPTLAQRQKLLDGVGEWIGTGACQVTQSFGFTVTTLPL